MSAFTRWVDGEHPIPLKTEFKPTPVKKPAKKRAPLGDQKRLDGFLRL